MNFDVKKQEIELLQFVLRKTRKIKERKGKKTEEKKLEVLERKLDQL